MKRSERLSLASYEALSSVCSVQCAVCAVCSVQCAVCSVCCEQCVASYEALSSVCGTPNIEIRGRKGVECRVILNFMDGHMAKCKYNL